MASMCSFCFWLFQADQQPMVGLAVLVNQNWSFAFGGVMQPGFHDGLRVPIHRPRGPLRLLVDRALKGKCVTGNFVGVVAAQDALLADRELQYQLRMLILIPDERKHTQR